MDVYKNEAYLRTWLSTFFLEDTLYALRSTLFAHRFSRLSSQSFRLFRTLYISQNQPTQLSFAMARFFAAILAVAAIMLQGTAAAAVPFPTNNGTIPAPGPTGTGGVPGPTGSFQQPRELRDFPINLARP